MTQTKGRLSCIKCPVHGLTYDLAGRWVEGSVSDDLTALEQSQPGHFILVRSPGSAGSEPVVDLSSPLSLAPAVVEQFRVAANWKLLIEQWLDETALPAGPRRTFLGPNQLLELSEARRLILQVIPDTPGSCHIRRLEYFVSAPSRRSDIHRSDTRRTDSRRTDSRRTDSRRTDNRRSESRRSGSRTVSRRSDSADAWLQQCIEVAESTQQGLVSGAFETSAAPAVSGPLAEFRRTIQSLLSAAEASRFGG